MDFTSKFHEKLNRGKIWNSLKRNKISERKKKVIKMAKKKDWRRETILIFSAATTKVGEAQYTKVFLPNYNENCDKNHLSKVV